MRKSTPEANLPSYKTSEFDPPHLTFIHPPPPVSPSTFHVSPFPTFPSPKPFIPISTLLFAKSPSPRQRARDAYKLLENIQDVKSRGGPAFPPATEGQLHHVQAGFAQLETYQDGFNLDGPTGQVNWIGAVSHVNSATWGSRVALDNADALAALLSTMQAIGARENAPIVRRAMIFESDTEENN